MARFAYIRVSSSDQNLERQRELLKDSNIDRFYEEKESGASINNRKVLQELLSIIRFDDVVVVTELDRLARKADDITYIINRIKEKEATLEVLDLPTTHVEDKNLRNLINNLIIEIYKYMAEAERNKIKERQRQGIELAKKAGRYTGRKKKYTATSPQLQQAFVLIDEGHSIREAARRTGMNFETLRKYLRERKTENEKRK